MVCYMYYTDVFVGPGNINNLKNALEAELNVPVNSDDLTQLVQGLCLFMGYPSCVCSLKANVNKSLKDISGKLKNDSEAVKSCVKTLNLNCSNCNSNDILCKCCVISCIKELPGKCSCPRLSNPSTVCKCQEPKETCCKDFLSGLEACLSMLNLKGDLAGCKCDPDCCKNGKCINKCDLCKPDKFPDNAMTGLGICPMNPKKLAQKLEEFFGDKASKTCSCQCGTSDKSCCCLACEDTQKCAQACNAECVSKGSCSSQPSTCPCKAFCIKINDFKIAAQAADRTCCSGGTQCHCGLDGSGPSKQKCQATSGQGSSGQGSSGKCCIEKDKSNYKHSVKCMIRRLVSYFKSLQPSSDPSKENFKSCCELLCVLKTCEFLKGFLTKGKCGKCTSGNSKCSSSGTSSCCKGDSSKCASNPNCCVGCQECCALKFRKAFSDLRFAGPCGQNLYRALDDFLNFIRFVFLPKVKDLRLENKIKEARDKCNECKTGSKTGGKHSSCNGCKSGSSGCQGCTAVLKELKDHKDVLSLMTRGYVSSYTYRFVPFADPPAKSTYASWDSLSPGEQKKAAKIFLGMLPCLYYGLKIVFDRSKYGSGFTGWHDISVNSDDSPKNDLAKFLYAWGFQTIESSGSSTIHLDPSLQAMVLPVLLENLFSSGSDSNGILKNLFETSKKYFAKYVFTPDPSKSLSPSTVRQMLLWLYGLRFTSGFHDLVSRCKDLCSPFGNSFNSDAFCYYIHTSCFLAPIAIISFIETSESAQKVFSSSSSPEWKSFSYPEDPSELFETFCDFVRKIYNALNFLSIQCRLPGPQVGWKECYFGGKCKKALEGSSTSVSSVSSGSSVSSDCSCPNSKTYLCTGKPYGTPDAHDHCISSKPGVSCLGLDGQCPDTTEDANSKNPTKDAHTNGKCDTAGPCPHHLMRFLIDDSESTSKALQNFRTPFRPPEGFPKMGFSKENLSPTAKKGSSLYAVLACFCESGFYPLTRLLQFSLCVSRYPETLGELFAFFFRFSESDVFKKHFESYVDGEPGSYRGKALQDAVRALYGSEESHKNSSHPSDLRSLIACDGPKGSSTCGRYLHPLTYNAYHGFIEGFLGTYLSWICYQGPTFYSEFKAFHTEAQKKFSCCSSGSCSSIVKCPCALPFLYSFGFGFWSPKGLNCESHGSGTHTSGKEGECTRRTCQDFITQLGKVLGLGSHGSVAPIKNLLRIIDEFIWHIRLPFVYAFLYIWILVISYFYYVQFYKLDLLHIDSHLHLPRSFKILPSTLFSDASSKLKDLSYFTL